MTFNLLQYIDEESEQQEQNGLVTEISVEGGWFVFQKGVQNEDRFWSFKNDEEAKVAREEALAKIDELSWVNSKGKKSSPLLALRVNVYGSNSVLNREEPPTWEVVPNYMVTFMEEYTSVFKPMSDLSWLEDYEYGTRVYAHVKYEVNPGNPSWTTPEGVEKQNLVPYIVQVFESREDAQLLANALMRDGEYVEVPEQPEKYAFDDWNAFYLGMVDAFRENQELDMSTYTDLEDEYGVSLSIVLGAKNAAKESLESSDVPF